MTEQTIITEAELFAEMDKMRYAEPSRLLSDTEFKAIHYARSTDGDKRAVSWSKLCLWWKKQGHADISNTGLKKRYEKECQRRGIEANLCYFS
jgi:hypothetical protein